MSMHWLRQLARWPGAFLFGLAMLQASQARDTPEESGYLGGSVRSTRGPEAGVWVIAESDELPTRFVKIVVTDDRGRFMLPELPSAAYRVWVRGYGLEDSAPVTRRPGREPVTLRVAIASSPQAAAKVYPASSWLSLLEVPRQDEFPGTGEQGNGLGTTMSTQAEWLYKFKLECNWCHQLGNDITRRLDHVHKARPELATSQQAWEWRLGTGVRGDAMYATLTALGRRRTTELLARWTDQIAGDEVPPAPDRPSGIERNLVVTLWDWGTDQSFMHDQAPSYRNDARVNAGGPVYGASLGHGALTVVDPRTNRAFEMEIPTRTPRADMPSRFARPGRPSFFWGLDHLWANPPYNPTYPHSPTLDRQGRVWVTSKIRPNPNPSWCSDPANRFADWFPIDSSVRQAALFDPESKRFILVDTCYSTHHLDFDADSSDTLYFNEEVGPFVGWIDTKVLDATHDEQKAVGWCGQVLDTNGDGRITRPWNRAGDRGTSFDLTRDTEVDYKWNSIAVNPFDHSVWGASDQAPGYIVRFERGNDPPSSCKTEAYRVPEGALGPRGIDVDQNGVIWTGLAVSGHLASFDRRKCQVVRGPALKDATHCPEGWTVYRTPGPRLKGSNLTADFHGYNWVDRYDALGLGKNVPFVSGTNSDALLALNPRTRRWTSLRVPYPMGFYPNGVAGRIDDPKAGWKGRGIWAQYATHFVWHVEGGRGTKGKLAHFQLRPSPLAR